MSSMSDLLLNGSLTLSLCFSLDVCFHLIYFCRVNHWLINHGFSIGIGDAVATSSVLAEIESTIGSAKTEVSNIINRARAGKLERTPGRTINETFEGEVNGVLNKATDQCGQFQRDQNQLHNARLSHGRSFFFVPPSPFVHCVLCLLTLCSPCRCARCLFLC